MRAVWGTTSRCLGPLRCLRRFCGPVLCVPGAFDCRLCTSCLPGQTTSCTVPGMCSLICGKPVPAKPGRIIVDPKTGYSTALDYMPLPASREAGYRRGARRDDDRDVPHGRTQD